MRIRSRLLAAAALLAGGAANAEVEQRVWSERYSFAPGTVPHLFVDNVWGNVTVTTHDEADVLLSVREVRRARSAQWLERSRSMLRLVAGADDGTLSVVLERPQGRWERDPCPGCELEATIMLTVPADASVDARTVLDGHVRIDGVRGAVTARNVNGRVLVTGARACDHLASVNGAVEIRFAAPPRAGRCDIETVNGDMRLALPPSADADFAFRVSHGRVSSELELATIPVTPIVERTAEGGVNRYRVVHPPAVRLGRGGPEFIFESLNGDVRIQESL